MPPQHGKSEMMSHYLPAWFLGLFPDKNVILAAHEASFATKWGRKVRDTLEEFGPSHFAINIRRDVKAADEWQIKGHRGGLKTAGVGQRVLGRNADLFVIDDPYGNFEDAVSVVNQEKIESWFHAVVKTRLRPGAAIVIINHRFDENDLTGKRLTAVENGVEEWEVISLPALAGKNDPLGRREGQALCPEWYDEKYLEALRASMGYIFEAMYQQNPSPTKEVIAFPELNYSHHSKPAAQRPKGNKILMLMDHGYSEPCAVGWLTFSDDYKQAWLFHEQYFWTGKPNEGQKKDPVTLARDIKDEERKIFGDDPVKEIIRLRIAGTDCWDKSKGQDIASQFGGEGLHLVQARVGKGSRIHKKQIMHSKLRIGEDGQPGLIICEECKQTWRTLLALRVDPKNHNDVNTKMEDHPYDMLTMGLMEWVAGEYKPEPKPKLQGKTRQQIIDEIQKRETRRT